MGALADAIAKKRAERGQVGGNTPIQSTKDLITQFRSGGTAAPAAPTPAAPAVDPTFEGMDGTPDPNETPLPPSETFPAPENQPSEIAPDETDARQGFGALKYADDALADEAASTEPTVPEMTPEEREAFIEAEARKRITTQAPEFDPELFDFNESTGTYTNKETGAEFDSSKVADKDTAGRSRAGEIGFSQGFTLSSDDELKSLFAADPQLERDIIRKSQELAAEEDAMRYYMGLITGGASSLIGGAGANVVGKGLSMLGLKAAPAAVPVARTTLGNATRVLGSGTAIGAVEGFNSGEGGVTDRLDDTAVGAGIGLVGGAGGALLAKVGGEVIGATVKGARNVTDRLLKSGKFTVPETEAFTRMVDAIAANSKLDPADVAQRIMDGEDALRMLADAGLPPERAAQVLNKAFKGEAAAQGALADVAEAKSARIRSSSNAKATANRVATEAEIKAAGEQTKTILLGATPDQVKSGIAAARNASPSEQLDDAIKASVRRMLKSDTTNILKDTGKNSKNAIINIADDGTITTLRKNAKPNKKGEFKKGDIIELDIVDGTIFRRGESKLTREATPDFGADTDAAKDMVDTAAVLDKAGKKAIPKSRASDAAYNLAKSKEEIRSAADKVIKAGDNATSDTIAPFRKALKDSNLTIDDKMRAIGGAFHNAVTAKNVPQISDAFKEVITETAGNPTIANNMSKAVDELTALAKTGDKSAIDAYKSTLQTAAEGGVEGLGPAVFFRTAVFNLAMGTYGAGKAVMRRGLTADPVIMKKVSEAFINNDPVVDEALAFVLRKKKVGNIVSDVIEEVVKRTGRAAAISATVAAPAP